MIKLSILIPVINKHLGFLSLLLKNLHSQIEKGGYQDQVEILINDAEKEPTGTKRNELLQRSTGLYVTHIDSDDEVPEYYIEEILKGIESNTDSFKINGIMTTNGGNEKKWFISKDNPYCSSIKDGKEIYLRYQNHICPVKREIAIQFKFPDITFQEDYIWATAMHKSGLIKTEYEIVKPLYHYKFLTNK